MTLSITDNEVLIRNSVFGLVLYGKVTAVAAPSFTVPSLAGFGAGRFDGATSPYYVFVIRKGTGAGTAPQGEQQPILTYNNATGAFTTAAFTVAIAVGDEILIINPNLAAALNGNTPHTEIPITLNAILANETPVLYLSHTVLITGTVSAPFTIGEVVNGVPSGAAGVVIAQTAGSITVVVTTGTFGLTDAVTGVLSASTVTVLTAITTTVPVGIHYTIDKLRIKSATPGVGNDVIVRLYELINNALILVDSFTITPANFTNYFSLMDMFGLPHLSGDNLEVTVQQEVGGGPTAILGEYVYRSS